jgi:uncharacterized protein YegP (UPF0339 family)
VNRILIKPAKRLFTRRLQWVFELRAANGALVDPRDTYNNRDEALAGILAFRTEPVEVVVYDKFGEVESRELLH